MHTDACCCRQCMGDGELPRVKHRGLFWGFLLLTFAACLWWWS
jgi:hypothetical protein